MSHFLTSLICLILSVGTGYAADAPIKYDDKTEVVLGRLGPPSKGVMRLFQGVGMKNVRYHPVTDEEREKIGAALASLPDIHRKVLVDHLDRLSFVDGILGAGTGLTSASNTKGSYSVTFRASLINESLTEFLTTKERTLFNNVKDGPIITVTAKGLDALPFGLLHESTHMVDSTFGIGRDLNQPLIHDIWKDASDLKVPYANSAVTGTDFRGKGKVSVRKAQSIYEAMQDSPFVSLYSSASAGEDIAELVAWYIELKRFNADLVIELSSAHAETIKRYRPLGFRRVKDRFEAVQKLMSMLEEGAAVSR